MGSLINRLETFLGMIPENYNVGDLIIDLDPADTGYHRYDDIQVGYIDHILSSNIGNKEDTLMWVRWYRTNTIVRLEYTFGFMARLLKGGFYVHKSRRFT